MCDLTSRLNLRQPFACSHTYHPDGALNIIQTIHETCHRRKYKYMRKSPNETLGEKILSFSHFSHSMSPARASLPIETMNFSRLTDDVLYLTPAIMNIFFPIFKWTISILCPNLRPEKLVKMWKMPRWWGKFPRCRHTTFFSPFFDTHCLHFLWVSSVAVYQVLHCIHELYVYRRSSWPAACLMTPLMFRSG